MSIFFPCLKGSRFTIRIDHNALSWVLHFANLNESWPVGVYDYQNLEFEVVHGAGINHQAPDALLRLRTTGSNQTPIKDKVLELCITAFIPFREAGPRVMHMQENNISHDNMYLDT